MMENNNQFQWDADLIRHAQKSIDEFVKYHNKGIFYLGQEITVENVLKRKTKWSVADKYGISKRLKVWEKVPLKNSKKAIIIGIMNLSNGNTDYDSDAGYMYNATEYFKALLVVSNLNNVPYLVPIKK